MGCPCLVGPCPPLQALLVGEGHRRPACTLANLARAGRAPQEDTLLGRAWHRTRTQPGFRSEAPEHPATNWGSQGSGFPKECPVEKGPWRLWAASPTGLLQVRAAVLGGEGRVVPTGPGTALHPGRGQQVRLLGWVPSLIMGLGLLGRSIGACCPGYLARAGAARRENTRAARI